MSKLSVSWITEGTVCLVVIASIEETKSEEFEKTLIEELRKVRKDL